MESKRYLINAACSVATRVLQLSVLIWVNQYLLKRIPTEEYSLLPLVMSLLIFGQLFKDAFISGVGRYIVEADAKGDREEITRIVSSVLPYFLGLCAFLLLLGGCAIYFLEFLIDIDTEYRDLARIMLSLLLLPLVLGVVGSPYSIGLYAKQRFVLQSGIDLFCEFLRIVLVLFLLLGVSTSVLWLVVGTVSASTLNLFLRIVFTRRWFPEIRFRRSAFSRERAKKLFGFSAWTSVGSVSNMAVNTVPVLLLGHFGTAVDVASYHLGRLPDVNIRRMALAAVMPIQPALTSLYAKDGKSALKDLYYRGGRYHLWITLILVAPLVVFAGPIMNLYAGVQYIQAAWVMMSLLLMYPVIWASAMFYRVAHASGIVGTYYRYEIITATVSVLAMFLMIVVLKLGALGAGLAVSGSAILTHLTMIWRKGLGAVEGRWSLFGKGTLWFGLLPFLSAILVALLSRVFIGFDDWLSIGIGVLLSLCAYVLILLKFCLGEEDQVLLHKALDRLAKLRGRGRATVSS